MDNLEETKSSIFPTLPDVKITHQTVCFVTGIQPWYKNVCDRLVPRSVNELPEICHVATGVDHLPTSEVLMPKIINPKKWVNVTQRHQWPHGDNKSLFHHTYLNFLASKFNGTSSMPLRKISIRELLYLRGRLNH